MVIPQAIGTDIQCGMRLHVCDISVEQFLSRKEEFVALLKGDLLLGTRDVPMRVSSMRALFDGGCVSWLDEVQTQPLGRLQMSSMRQLVTELDRVYGMGSYDGSCKWAPHGAGRLKTRYEMRHKRRANHDLGLTGVECITLKEERLVQEAPAAYKPIQPVVDIQAEVGIASIVARMRPLLTFKA